MSISAPVVRRHSEEASRTAAAFDDEESVMLYFPTHTLSAIENDRLRAAARYRLVAKVRREQATLVPKRRGLRWQVFRVSSMTGSAS
ncbi:MAG: hypothetical protein WAK83_30575 [Trebonia sp.]|uniref:hypothetical protein n=1 Tax=Trebonia sp. TaxID=2767075 RepID=UPI003BB217DF